MARSAEKVTQQSVTKLQDLMNFDHKNMLDARSASEAMKGTNEHVAQILATSALKFEVSYVQLAGKIVRRLTDEMTDSNVSLNKWIDSVKPNLPQA